MCCNFNGNIFPMYVHRSPWIPSGTFPRLALAPAQCDIHYARACSINMTERDSDDRRTDGRTDEDTGRRGRGARLEAARVSNTSCLLANDSVYVRPFFTVLGLARHGFTFIPDFDLSLAFRRPSAGILAREGTDCSDGQSNKKQSDGRGAMSVQIPEIFHLFPSKAQNARARSHVLALTFRGQSAPGFFCPAFSAPPSFLSSARGARTDARATMPCSRQAGCRDD